MTQSLYSKSSTALCSKQTNILITILWLSPPEGYLLLDQFIEHDLLKRFDSKEWFRNLMRLGFNFNEQLQFKDHHYGLAPVDLEFSCLF